MASRSRKKELRDEAKAEYKERIKQVRELDRNEDPLKIQDIIAENLERGDELYSRVKKKLDGTTFDARHMRELVNLCQESSKRINATTKQFDLKKIIQKLFRDYEADNGSKLSTQEFSRLVAERHVKTFLLKPPTFEFFYGALKSEDLEIVVKKRKAPREKITTSTQAVTAKERNMEVEVEQDSTPKFVEHINAEINRLAKDKQGGIPLFATLVDPNSFAQTVENLFHTSFLVKEGRVGVMRGRSKVPVLTLKQQKDNGQSQEREGPTTERGKQSLLTFSMSDFNAWISTYNIRRSSLGARSTDEASVQNEDTDGTDIDVDEDDY